MCKRLRTMRAPRSVGAPSLVPARVQRFGGRPEVLQALAVARTAWGWGRASMNVGSPPALRCCDFPARYLALAKALRGRARLCSDGRVRHRQTRCGSRGRARMHTRPATRAVIIRPRLPLARGGTPARASQLTTMSVAGQRILCPSRRAVPPAAAPELLPAAKNRGAEVSSDMRPTSRSIWPSCGDSAKDRTRSSVARSFAPRGQTRPSWGSSVGSLPK